MTCVLFSLCDAVAAAFPAEWATTLLHHLTRKGELKLQIHGRAAAACAWASHAPQAASPACKGYSSGRSEDDEVKENKMPTWYKYTK